MPVFHLLEYKIYSMTSRSLPNCYRDEINDGNDNNVTNNMINNNKTITSKYFKYKTKLIGSTPNNNSVTSQKKIYFLFPNVLKDDLSEKIALEYDLFCIIWKNSIFFTKIYFSFGREIKDDLSQKIHGNMISFLCMYKCYKYDITDLQNNSKVIDILD